MFNWKKNHRIAATDHNGNNNGNGKIIKEFIIDIDPKMGLSAEEFDKAMKGFAIIAERQKAANANS